MKPAALVVEDYLTPAEVCERLRLEQHTVLRLLRPGAIWPVVRLSRKTIRIPASSLLRYLKAHTWEPKGVAAG